MTTNPETARAALFAARWGNADDFAAAVDAYRDVLAPAVAPSPPATDRATLRDRVAEALALRANGPASDGRGWYRDEEQRQALLSDADAVLAVLPDDGRATVYAEVAELVRSMAPEHPTNASWVQDCHHIADRIDEAVEESDGLSDALIEDYLRHLRGQGPEPDLSELPPEQREAVAGQFEIVKALADRGPELPPLDRDPVAQRLGLVDAPAVGARQPDTETQACRSAALTEAADLAKAEGDRLYSDRWPTAAQAAWTLAEKLRALAAAGHQPASTATEA